MISDQNISTRGSILYYTHFEIAKIQDLVSSNILSMHYLASLRLNSSIFRGNNESLRNKSCKICHMILSVFQALKSWLFCSQCSVLIGWEKDAIQSKKNGAIWHVRRKRFKIRQLYLYLVFVFTFVFKLFKQAFHLFLLARKNLKRTRLVDSSYIEKLIADTHPPSDQHWPFCERFLAI